MPPVGRSGPLKRRHLLLPIAAFIAFAAIVCGLAFKRHLLVAYHHWRMEAAYGSLFSNPQPVGDGLAAFDVTATDVDAALESYKSHRQALVDLGALAHVRSSFPRLASDGTGIRSEDRSAFVERMWDVFPSHRHYYLAPDGTFDSWVPIGTEQRWRQFLDGESKSLE